MAEAQPNLTERVLARLEDPLRKAIAELEAVSKSQEEYDRLFRALVDYGTACVAIASEETYKEADAAFSG